jgi:hypothetical protein
MAGSAGPSGAGLRVFVSHTSELREFPEGASYVAAVERAISACGHVIVNMADFPWPRGMGLWGSRTRPCPTG